MKKSYLNILLVSLLLFCSCNQVVKIDVPRSENKLVVNSIFNPDSVISLTLSHSEFILENGEFEKIEGATALLLNKEGVKLDKMSYAGNGIYKSDIKPIPGKTYRIKVSQEGYKTVTSQNKVPAEPARIVKVKVNKKRNNTNDDMPFRDYDITLTVWLDDPKGSDFYEIYFFDKATIIRPSVSDTFVNKRYHFLRSNEAVFHEFNAQNPEPTQGRFLIFDDDLFNESTIKLRFDATTKVTECPPVVCNVTHDFTLYIRKTSEAYYRYNKTVAKQDEQEENPFAEPVFVYDNIKNGLGIFAGFNVSTYHIKIE